jgi:putative membrane protein
MKNYSKFFGITAVILAIVAFFPARLQISPENAMISGIFIIIMAIPCYVALVVWLGLNKSLSLIIILSIYAISIETFAIITGFPYSSFHYSNLIGFKILGYTPYTVPFAYVPLFVGCFYLATLLSKEKWKIVIFSTLMVLLADMVLDPAAVTLNFWIYDSSGIFYGVPLMNFMGWILTGFLASMISMYLLKDRLDDYNKPPALISSLFLILTFWSAVCIYMGLWIPALIGVMFIVIILQKTNAQIGEFL